MKIVLAPQVTARLDGPRPFSREVLERYPSIEVPDTSDRLLIDVISDTIRANADIVVGAESQIDAPPYSTDWWWLAVITQEGDPSDVMSFGPGFFYGVDTDGRVHFLFRSEIRVADYIRALEAGHYPTTQHTLLVTRGGEFGGNGAMVASLLVWLLQGFPWILMGYGIDKASLRHDQKKQDDLEKLAIDWAARRIKHPAHLRMFVTTRQRWFATALAERLALSEAAAARLLTALGYEPGEGDVMEYHETAQGLAARQAWQEAERREDGLASLDELFDDE